MTSGSKLAKPPSERIFTRNNEQMVGPLSVMEQGKKMRRLPGQVVSPLFRQSSSPVGGQTKEPIDQSTSLFCLVQGFSYLSLTRYNNKYYIYLLDYVWNSVKSMLTLFLYES